MDIWKIRLSYPEHWTRYCGFSQCLKCNFNLLLLLLIIVVVVLQTCIDYIDYFDGVLCTVFIVFRNSLTVTPLVSLSWLFCSIQMFLQSDNRETTVCTYNRNDVCQHIRACEWVKQHCLVRRWSKGHEVIESSLLEVDMWRHSSINRFPLSIHGSFTSFSDRPTSVSSLSC